MVELTKEQWNAYLDIVEGLLVTDAKPTAEERAERLHQQDCACPSDTLTRPVDRANCRRCLAAEIRAAQAEVFDGLAMDLEGASCGYDECDHDDCGAVRMIAKYCQKRAAALRESK